MVNSSQRTYFPSSVEGLCSISYQFSLHSNYYEGDCFLITLWIRKRGHWLFLAALSVGIRFDVVCDGTVLAKEGTGAGLGPFAR